MRNLTADILLKKLEVYVPIGQPAFIVVPVNSNELAGLGYSVPTLDPSDIDVGAATYAVKNSVEADGFANGKLVTTGNAVICPIQFYRIRR